MTATERLRELLDERGVEWWNDTDPEPQRQTNVWAGGQLVTFHENANGTVGYVVYSTHDLTPEQAIAATLGAGTCKDVCANISEFTCSACGFNCELASWISLFDGDDGRHRHHYHGTPNFCPNCGRKVVDE